MGYYKDVTGNRYNKLIAIKFVETGKWLFKCDCGNETIARIGNVKKGTTTSCGCYGLSIYGKTSITHGLTKTPEYRTWSDMKTRCYDPYYNEYQHYGG